jgi:hypothetical protein
MKAGSTPSHAILIMTPESEIASEVRKIGHRWVDLSVAVCALIVSVTSLWVAVRHGHTMERMADANARLVAANSYPLLQHFKSSAADLQSIDVAQGRTVISMNVVNSGVGPAKVETLEVFWNDRPVRTARELLRMCCDSSGEDTSASLAAGLLGTSDLQGMMLRAGEVSRLLIISRREESAALAARFNAAYSKLRLRACYCSVFDECWSSDLQTLHPQAVASCPKPDVPFAPPSI